jgi:hypothetical protein
MHGGLPADPGGRDNTTIKRRRRPRDLPGTGLCRLAQQCPPLTGGLGCWGASSCHPHWPPRPAPPPPRPAWQGSVRKYKKKGYEGFTRNYTALWERLAQASHMGRVFHGASPRDACPCACLVMCAALVAWVWHGHVQGAPSWSTVRPPRSAWAAGCVRSGVHVTNVAIDGLQANSGQGGAKAAAGGTGPVRVVVVGNGEKKNLGLPQQLEQYVDFYSRLRYTVCGAKFCAAEAGQSPSASHRAGKPAMRPFSCTCPGWHCAGAANDQE